MTLAEESIVVETKKKETDELLERVGQESIVAEEQVTNPDPDPDPDPDPGPNPSIGPHPGPNPDASIGPGPNP